MGKLLKILLGLAGGLLLLAVAAVLVVPRLIDAEKYKALVLGKVAEATGREVVLGGELNVSVFPWVGVSLNDFRLGNPQGFGSDDFVRVKSFEAHVKLMPLLKREVEVDSFILDSPEIYLEKRKDGVANWQGLGGDGKAKGKQPQQEQEKEGLGLKSIEVGTFTIRNAHLKYVDQQQGVTKEVSGLTLQLTDVSLERPVNLLFEAIVDGRKVGVSGVVGPLGAQPGKGPLPVDLNITALDVLQVKVAGKLDNPATDNLAYDLKIDIPSFSPRSLLDALGMPMPIVTRDPKALDAVALALQVKGGLAAATVPAAEVKIDESMMAFSLEASRFEPLNLVFAGKLDRIDLDRYLPATAKEPAESSAGSGGGQAKQKAAIDYAPLRKLALDTKLDIGELKVKGGKMQNIQLRLVADKGIFHLNPFAMELYGGKVASTAKLNVQGKSPATSLEARTTNVQVGPLLKDFAQKDVLEGNLVSTINLTMQGDTPAQIKKTLNGKGELLFTDGAIVGIDLAGMVRNVQASFGLAEKPTERPRTDFAELRAPFTLTNGLFNTPGTTMQSPLLRVTVSGDANLVTEALDMKVNPKFVATLKGQGDTAERKGLMVPVLVRGTFSKPEFAPDLTALLQGQIPDGETIKKTLEEGLAPDKVLPKDTKSLEEGIKGLIPGLKLK